MIEESKFSKMGYAIIILIILTIFIAGAIVGYFVGKNSKTKEYETYQKVMSPTTQPSQSIQVEPIEPVRIIIEVENHSQYHCEEAQNVSLGLPRYGFTEDDIYLLAQLLCGSYKIDGDGEYDFVWEGATYDEINFVEVSKVLCVVMNRVNGDGWPNTVKEVVLQPGQFSVMPANLNTTPSDLAISIIKDWCVRYDLMLDDDIFVIPSSHVFFSSGGNLTNITREDW